MHIRLAVSFLLIFLFNYSFSQYPKPYLQKAAGGYGNDEAVAFTKTWDNGYAIISNNSNSSGGDIDEKDKEGINTSSMYNWIVKLDSNRKVRWQQKIHQYNYTGLGPTMFAKDIIETKDSGIVVVGWCMTNGFDQTTSWAFKFSKYGKLVWKHILPLNTMVQAFSEVKEAADGSLVIAGHKLINRWSVGAAYSGWILVLNSNGTLKWQRSYFNINPFNRYLDLKFITVDIEENGFLIGGELSGGNLGYPDLYLFRVNFNGDSLWSAKYGGNGEEFLNDVLPLPDGYLLVATAEENNGDVSGIHCVNGASFCRQDAWILKVNKNGNIIWKQAYGDYDVDIPAKAVITGNGYYVVGYKDSQMIGATMTKGGTDVWGLDLDKNGNLVTPQAFYGGPKNDYGRSVLIDTVRNKAFPVILSTTESESGGEVEGFHNATGWSNDKEVWLFTLGYFNTIKGIVFYDLNKNGIKESAEPLFKRGIISLEAVKDTVLHYNTTGEYVLKVDQKGYTVKYNLHDSAFAVVPASRRVDFTGDFATETVDFAVQLRPGISDVSIAATPVSFARPGFGASYQLMLVNRSGDTVKSKQVYFIKDKRTIYVSATPVPSRITGDSIIWNYTNLKYTDTLRFNLDLRITAPPVVQINDTLNHKAWAPLANDADTMDNMVHIKQIVRGSYDPNDKSETHAGTISAEQASRGEYMNYLVRFQNTGTDTAFTVTIRDTLDNALDLSTFEMITVSHRYEMSIQNRMVEWVFPGINLADSTTNEKASHGYIAFRIKTRNNLPFNAVIRNNASIYFDYNLPIKTNTTVTAIEGGHPGGSGPVTVAAGSAKLIPNPASGLVNLQMKPFQTGESSVKIFNVFGQQVFSRKLGPVIKDQEHIFPLKVSGLASGMYAVVVYINEKWLVQQLIIR